MTSLSARLQGLRPEIRTELGLLLFTDWTGFGLFAVPCHVVLASDPEMHSSVPLLVSTFLTCLMLLAIPPLLAESEWKNKDLN